MSTIEKAAARLAARQKAEAETRSKTRASSIEKQASSIDRKTSENGHARDREHPVRTLRGGPAAQARALAHCEINLAAIEEKGYLTPGVGRSQLAQEMRRIKRPLLLNIQRAQAKGDSALAPNLIMVTSALPGEGKTFVSINLAMSMAAEVDRRVLLVDADVARGDLSRQLGVHDRRGLSDLLGESSYLSEDGVIGTNVERLSLLAAGAGNDHVDELFASGMMSVLTQALANEDPNRVIIFDASPLLATTEAGVLAQYMGQTLVVVEANKTPQDAVGQALSQLDGCADVCVMLNKATGKDTSGYSYGYGYGYGDGQAPDRYGREREAV